MVRILCYGDSNTYGYNPENTFRYPSDVRWTGRLSSLLGKNFEVIEEGLNNRTTALEPEGEPWRSGLYYLEPCLRSHIPINVFILMLGSNDMKKCFHQTADEIGEHIRQCITKIRQVSAEKNPTGQPCKIILISPFLITDDIKKADYADEFGGDFSIDLSKQLALIYRQIAEEEDCVYLNGAEITSPSEMDGLHLDPEGHKKLAETLAEKLKVLFPF